MKKMLIFLFAMIVISSSVFAQPEQKKYISEKDVTAYIGFTSFSGPTDPHQGTAIRLTFPLLSGRFGIGAFATSITDYIYEARGGWFEYSTLGFSTTTEDNLRLRPVVMISYSERNRVGTDKALSEKLFTVSGGVRVVYDLWKKLAVEVTATIGYASILNLPSDQLAKVNKSGLGGNFTASVKLPF